jgi:hypothetical protein
MRFVGLENPVLKEPFTVVDPAGSVWAVATDRIWFVAARGKNTCPRFKGEATALFTVLKLLGMKASEPQVFNRRLALARIDPEEYIGMVLGVPVSLRRLRDLLESLPAETLEGWNASDDLGVPGVGVACDGWRAYLIGFDSVVGEVPEFELSSNAFDRAMSLAED